MRECRKCGRAMAVKGIGMHERSCFTTLAEFVELVEHRLTLDRVTGCVFMRRWNGQPFVGRPVFNGRNVARQLLALQLGRPLSDFPHEVVRHKCDVEQCVNWWHLEPGTIKDNNQDIWDRQRAKRPAVTGPCEVCGTVVTFLWQRANRTPGRLRCSRECSNWARGRARRKV